MLPALLALALQAGPAPPGEGVPSPPPPGEGPVVLFLVDNSASLPPLDPGEKRRVALENRATFVFAGSALATFFDPRGLYEFLHPEGDAE